MYGGATPAGGAFATLQAMGMTGTYTYFTGAVSSAAAAVAGGLVGAMGKSKL